MDNPGGTVEVKNISIDEFRSMIDQDNGASDVVYSTESLINNPGRRFILERVGLLCLAFGRPLRGPWAERYFNVRRSSISSDCIFRVDRGE